MHCARFRQPNNYGAGSWSWSLNLLKSFSKELEDEIADYNLLQEKSCVFQMGNSETAAPPPQSENASNSPEAEVYSGVARGRTPLLEVLEPVFYSLIPGDPDGYVVPVVEVERLWSRFQQLGTNKEGVITDVILQTPPFARNPYLRQVWKTVPRDQNGNVTFRAFVGIIKWWEMASVEQKLRGVFKLLNRSQPLDAAALIQVLTAIEGEGGSKGSATRKAKLLISHLDDKNQGFIDEEQWVRWLIRMPQEEIQSLIHLYVIPPEIYQKSEPAATRCDSDSAVPDQILITITDQLGERDWVPAATALGLGEKDCRRIRRKYPGRAREQSYQMLLLWKQQRGEAANLNSLYLALRNSGFEYIATGLNGERDSV